MNNQKNPNHPSNPNNHPDVKPIKPSAWTYGTPLPPKTTPKTGK